jgi:uncharacterized protein (TIGR01777 family)
MRVVVAGGTGLIGTALTAALAGAGHDVVVLTRRPVEEVRGLPKGARAVRWSATADPLDGWAGDLDGAGGVINLAGASIGTRPWTAGRVREILESRLRATSALVAAMAALPAQGRPAVLLNASGVDYYGERGDETLDEESPAGGGAVLAAVCERWEAAALEAEPLGVRVVRLRTGMVLARGALALRLMSLPFRLFLGGRTGSGRQWVSWVHLEDVVGLYGLALRDPGVSGALNVVAPEPVRNAEMAAEIGRTLHRPVWLPQPAPLLRLAMRGQSELLLVGHRVVPAVALGRGYEFRYPAVGPALTDALGPVSLLVV